MNDLLPAALRARVGGSRWLPLHAKAEVGVGARSSKAVGPGIEFAQYRDYEPGDDLRYLDKNVYARLGRTVVRQFTVDRQLRVHVLLDRSASMAIEDAKWALARQITALCTLLTLNGGDRAVFASFGESGLRWGAPFSQSSALDDALDRIAELEPDGRAPALDEVARRSLEHLRGSGLLVVVSDWLTDGVAEAVKLWRARGQELLAVQVLAGTDVEPNDDLMGWSRLVDVETHEVSERYVDARVLADYRDVFDGWQASVQDAVWKAEGRWLSVRADRDDATTVLSALRRSGTIT